MLSGSSLEPDTIESGLFVSVTNKPRGCFLII